MVSRIKFEISDLGGIRAPEGMAPHNITLLGFPPPSATAFPGAEPPLVC